MIELILACRTSEQRWATEQGHAAHREEPQMSSVVVITISPEENDLDLISRSESSELCHWSFGWVLIKENRLEFLVRN